MKKYAIGLIAAALGASSALAAQAPANFDAALSASSRNGNDGVVAKRKSTAQLRTTSGRKGSVSVSSAAGSTRAGMKSTYDAKLDATTFLWADARMPAALLAPVKRQKLAETAARQYLAKQAAPLKLSKATVANARVVDVHDVGHGPIVTRFRQFHDGVEVFGQNLSVMMGRDMKLVATSGYFAPSSAFEKTSKKGPATSAKAAFSLTAEQALARAFSDLTGQKTSPSLFTAKAQKGDYTQFAVSSQSTEIRAYGTPRAKKVWYYNEGKLTAGWYVEVSGRSVDLVDDFGYSYVVSATDGAVLFRKNLSEDAAFNYRVYADANGIKQPFDAPIGNDTAPYPAPGTQNQNLPRIAATPNLVTLESGPISTGDPWLADNATETLGNNVDAYLDLVDGGVRPPETNPDDRVDGFTPNSDDQRGTVNAANTFSFPYTPDADPSTASQRQHAVTHLFYINNWLHDWWYDNGFDEASGNAQTVNYDRGGEEGDVLLAEGQDFSGRNNANQRTPADGGSPRQQMYLFDGAVNGELTVAAPIGALSFGTASFGAQLFDVSGTVVASAPANGCSALSNAADVAGKIALIDRGTCGFVVKVKNAQDAGATGVIIANNAAGAAPGLGGADATITIGTLSVSQSDGAAIRAALPTTARLRRGASIDVDGTLDTQIIAHEWFHYASNRLVGNASGLTNQQGRGMGEGWSDFSALMLTVRPEDRNATGNANFEGAYPIAVYSTRDSYFGIRRAPYSTNFDVFPFTFKHISDGVALPTNAPILNFNANSQVHNTGSIWANTLWEFYVSLLNDPRYSFVQAQERMKDYVIAGLKMTPNAPTLLEARDAILAAALATDPTDYELAAAAFAKRGMGAGAIAPDRNSATNQNPNAVEDFTVFAGNLSVTDASLDFTYFDGALGFVDNDGVLDPGETALLTVSLVNNGTAEITDDITATISSDGDVLFQTTEDRTAETPVAGAATGTISFPGPIPIGGTATGTIEVTLSSASGTAQQVNLTLDFPDAGETPTSVFEPGSQTISLDVNYDIAANARETDDLEQPQASSIDWGRTLIGTGDNWEITDGDAAPFLFETGNIWTVPDNSSPSDVRLTTPPLVVAAAAAPTATGEGPFTMTFEHYYQFEFAGFDDDGTAVGYDGGVIEITSDGGATWQDVVAAGGTFTSGGGYNGVVLALSTDGTFTPTGSETPAAAFVGNNFSTTGGFLEPVTLSLPSSFAGQTVRLRFRMVTDTSTGDFGWSIDNVSFTGITVAPFSSVVAEDGVADNAAPVAVAGDDAFIAVGREATLDGSDSTDDVGIESFAWVQTGGPEVELTDADTAAATFTPTELGEYSFALTVTDERQVSTTDEITLTVIAAPIANAGADQETRPFRDVRLDGRGSSAPAPGSTLTYAWVQTSGPTATLTGATTATPTFRTGETGAYVFRLRVTDSQSRAVSEDFVTVNATIPAGGSFGYLMLLPGLVAVWLRRRRQIGK
ncbi:MAG: M36 family metallopeptidase [Nevskia sp.]|nr:M36 family metallopeptidase [Nevskia sp.]